MSYLLNRFVNEQLKDNNDPISIQACVQEVQEAFALNCDEAETAVMDILVGTYLTPSQFVTKYSDTLLPVMKRLADQ